MNTQGDLLKIGDFAKLANTNLRTLRYYEEIGLIQPASRSQGGFRYYRATDVYRVQMIRSLQELGLHLDRIKELMASRTANENHAIFLARSREALLEQERLLRQKLAALQDQQLKLTQALNKLNECQHCQHSPTPENNFCTPCATTGEQLPAHLSALYQ